jgi:hypothetical protein
MSAQNESVFELTDKTDDFSGDRHIRSSEEVLGKTKQRKEVFVEVINGQSGELNFWVLSIFTSQDIGCSGTSRSYLKFKFTDDSVLELNEDMARVKCNDYAKSTYIIDPTDFEGKEISLLRFAQGDYYVDVNVLDSDIVDDAITSIKAAL